MRVAGVTAAKIAVFVGDLSNNEAEYLGAFAVLEHAVYMGYNRVLIYGDSVLVVRHLNGKWKCNAAHLAHYYERGWALMRRLHVVCEAVVFCVAHVYREFNADADSLANIAIAQRRPGELSLIHI